MRLDSYIRTSYVDIGRALRELISVGSQTILAPIDFGCDLFLAQSAIEAHCTPEAIHEFMSMQVLPCTHALRCITLQGLSQVYSSLRGRAASLSAQSAQAMGSVIEAQTRLEGFRALASELYYERSSERMRGAPVPFIGRLEQSITAYEEEIAASLSALEAACSAQRQLFIDSSRAFADIRAIEVQELAHREKAMSLLGNIKAFIYSYLS